MTPQQAIDAYRTAANTVDSEFRSYQELSDQLLRAMTAQDAALIAELVSTMQVSVMNVLDAIAAARRAYAALPPADDLAHAPVETRDIYAMFLQAATEGQRAMDQVVERLKAIPPFDTLPFDFYREHDR